MHDFLIIIALSALSAAFLSLWVKKQSSVWGSLFLVSMLTGFLAGMIDWMGLGFIAALLLLWRSYQKKATFLFFSAIVLLSVIFKLRVLPGFYPYFVTEKFALGLEGSLIGLFPLALLVPLAKSAKDWKAVFKGFVFGCAGIAVIALLAVSSGTIRLNFQIPAFMLLRTFSNLVLTSIPEEGFFRGFVQKAVADYLRNGKWANILAILLSSTLFTLVHIFWTSNPAILAFTFIASLLYGAVYWFSGKIESAILTHFFLNLIHMTLFS